MQTRPIISMGLWAYYILKKGKSMAKLTEGQKLYWRYLIDDNNDEAVSVEVEVVKDDSEIEVEYEIERKVPWTREINYRV